MARMRSACSWSRLFRSRRTSPIARGSTTSQSKRSPPSNAGANATFVVAATGSAPLSFQWRRNGAALAGATNATLALLNVTPADAGSYTADVTNSAGAITSEQIETRGYTNYADNVVKYFVRQAAQGGVDLFRERPVFGKAFARASDLEAAIKAKQVDFAVIDGV